MTSGSRSADVHAVAAYFAGHLEVDWLVDIGCGDPVSVAQHAEEFLVAGVGPGADIERCRELLPLGAWLEADLTSAGWSDPVAARLSRSVVACRGVLDRLSDPEPLLAELTKVREVAPLMVVSAGGSPGLPGCATGARHSLDEFRARLTGAGLAPDFLGRTGPSGEDTRGDEFVAVIEGAGVPALEPAPPGFRALAVVTGHNEADILPFTLRRLVDDGFEVVYLDNWSNDGSYESVRERFAGSVHVERFPTVDTHTFGWAELLARVEEIGRRSEAQWVVHHDADEIRESPWPGVGLRDGLWNVQRRGFNAVNHQVIDFRPTAEDPVPDGVDPTTVLTWWEHLSHPANLVQVKAWRNTGQAVGLAATGGHEVRFPGRRIFPYRFLLRHYPLRSPDHARRKIFQDRVNRWEEAERDRGWHRHYDHVSEQDSFVWAREDLHRWDPAGFAVDQLAERLTGLGVLDDDPGGWAETVTNPPTPPRLELQRWRADRARLLDQLDRASRELASAQERRAALEAEVASARGEMAAMELSRSWRLTRPLRSASTLARRASTRQTSS